MAEPASAAVAETGGKKGLSKGKIIGFVIGIVLLQCVLAWLYLPSGDAAKAEAKKDAAARTDDRTKDIDRDAAAGDAKGENREVDLGKFSLTAFDPNSNTTLLIDFHLYGTVSVDPSEKGAKDGGEGGHAARGKDGGDDDNTTFGRLFKKNQHRFRDQVIVIIRNATMADLADPSLGLIKRQILAKTNSLLGEPLLKEVVFSDFAVVQQ